jgi:hypothetical protein
VAFEPPGEQCHDRECPHALGRNTYRPLPYGPDTGKYTCACRDHRCVTYLGGQGVTRKNSKVALEPASTGAAAWAPISTCDSGDQGKARALACGGQLDPMRR